MDTMNSTAGKPRKPLQFCTQKCLLGLADGSYLDHKCPNYDRHRSRKTEVNNMLHPLTHEQFLEKLTEQLSTNLDEEGFTCADMCGSTGTLFSVTLLGYGYKFMCKGASEDGLKEAAAEVPIYERLKDIQGTHVPVYLGHVNLKSLGKSYTFGTSWKVEYLWAMSWAGIWVGYYKDDASVSWKNVMAKAEAALGAVHEKGVLHRDLHVGNVLYNDKADSVVIIDFGRSVSCEDLDVDSSHRSDLFWPEVSRLNSCLAEYFDKEKEVVWGAPQAENEWR